MAYAIYELEPIGKDGALEANGTVHFYCSEGCRSAERTDFKGYIAEGEDHDWTDGTRCEWCTTPLQTTKAPTSKSEATSFDSAMAWRRYAAFLEESMISEGRTVSRIASDEKRTEPPALFERENEASL